MSKASSKRPASRWAPWRRPCFWWTRPPRLSSARSWTTAALERLAEACSAACRPIDDKRGTIEFRRKVAGVLAKRAATIAYERAGGKVMSGVAVSTTINGDDVEFLCQPDETLLDVLRDRLGLTGAKEGCGTGDCGACSIILDDRLVCSCLVLGAEAEGRASRPSRAWRMATSCIRCSRSSSSTPHCNAASARRAS